MVAVSADTAAIKLSRAACNCIDSFFCINSRPQMSDDKTDFLKEFGLGRAFLYLSMYLSHESVLPMNKRRKYRSLPSRAPPLADHLLRLCRGLRLHSRLRFRFARLGLGLSLGEQPAHLSVSRSKVGVGNQISASRCEVTQYFLLTAARACATLPRTRTISPQLAQASATYLLTRSYLLLTLVGGLFKR